MNKKFYLIPFYILFISFIIYIIIYYVNQEKQKNGFNLDNLEYEILVYESSVSNFIQLNTYEIQDKIDSNIQFFYIQVE